MQGLQADVIPYNTLISAYGKPAGHRALELLKEMRMQSLQADAIPSNTALAKVLDLICNRGPSEWRPPSRGQDFRFGCKSEAEIPFLRIRICNLAEWRPKPFPLFLTQSIFQKGFG